MVETSEVFPKVIGLLVLGVAFMFLVKMEALNREKVKDIKIPNENIFAVLGQKIKAFFQAWNTTSKISEAEDSYSSKNQVTAPFGISKQSYNLSTDNAVNTVAVTNDEGSWPSLLVPMNVTKRSADEVASHFTHNSTLPLYRHFQSKIGKTGNLSGSNSSGESNSKRRKAKKLLFSLSQKMQLSDHKVDSEREQSTASSKITFTPDLLNSSLNINDKEFLLLTVKQQIKNLISNFLMNYLQSLKSTRAKYYLLSNDFFEQEIKKPLYFAKRNRRETVRPSANSAVKYFFPSAGEVINETKLNDTHIKVQKSHQRKLLSLIHSLKTIGKKEEQYGKKTIQMFRPSSTNHLNYTEEEYVNAAEPKLTTIAIYSFIQTDHRKYNKTMTNQLDRSKSNSKWECFSKWDVLTLVISVSFVAMMLGCFAAIIMKCFFCHSCPATKDHFSADKWWSAEDGACSLTTFIRHAAKAPIKTSSKSHWSMSTDQNSITPLLSPKNRVHQCEMENVNGFTSIAWQPTS